jgi:signal transduction histidine kinase
LKDFIEQIKLVVERQEAQAFGLSIAQTIVKLHGGNIKVSNNEPKGTKFTIKI